MEFDTSGPSIEEMQSMLARPIGVDFYPVHSAHHQCSKCQTEKSDSWIVVNGTRFCSRCGRS